MSTSNKPFLVRDDLVIDNSPGRQFVVPWGGDGERPSSPSIGATRLNQDRGVLEIFNGSEWQSAAQAGDAVNASGAEEIALVQAIIFG